MCRLKWLITLSVQLQEWMNESQLALTYVVVFLCWPFRFQLIELIIQKTCWEIECQSVGRKGNRWSEGRGTNTAVLQNPKIRSHFPVGSWKRQHKAIPQSDDQSEWLCRKQKGSGSLTIMRMNFPRDMAFSIPRTWGNWISVATGHTPVLALGPFVRLYIIESINKALEERLYFVIPSK